MSAETWVSPTIDITPTTGSPAIDQIVALEQELQKYEERILQLNIVLGRIIEYANGERGELWSNEILGLVIDAGLYDSG